MHYIAAFQRRRRVQIDRRDGEMVARKAADLVAQGCH